MSEAPSAEGSAGLGSVAGIDMNQLAGAAEAASQVIRKLFSFGVAVGDCSESTKSVGACLPNLTPRSTHDILFLPPPYIIYSPSGRPGGGRSSCSVPLQVRC